MRKICFLLFCCVYSIFGLNHQDSLNVIDNFFSQHISFHEWDTRLIERFSATFIEQLDPYSMYFYKDEVVPYYVMDYQKKKYYLQQHKEGIHELSKHLYSLGGKAILRSREIRNRLSAVQLLQGKPVYGYPDNYASLKSKIAYVARVWIEKKSGQQFASLNISDQEAYFRLWNQAMDAHERGYKVQSTFNPLQKGGDEEALVLYTLKAFARALDPHTGYFSKMEAEHFRQMLSKQFYGLGIQIKQINGEVVIVAVIPDSSADRCKNVFEGESIKSINGETVSLLPFEAVLEKLSGKKGDLISLVIKSEQREKKVDLYVDKVVMEHERVQVKKYHHKGGEVLHLVFDSFYDNGDNVSLASDMKEILKNLSKDTMGLVLDFRNNTGGFMQQAVDFSHLFLEESIVVLTEYANGDIVHSKPHDGPALYKGPLVILTSRHTASAAEVVAAALKEYNVAMIIGDESTYGKGSVQYQTIMNEDEPHPYKITIARYFTISGQSIQKKGVVPHLVVPTQHAESVLGEKKLKYALAAKDLDVTKAMKGAPPHRKKSDLYASYAPKKNQKLEKLFQQFSASKADSTESDQPLEVAIQIISQWCQHVKKIEPNN